jgi:hypothetical protein
MENKKNTTEKNGKNKDTKEKKDMDLVRIFHLHEFNIF